MRNAFTFLQHTHDLTLHPALVSVVECDYNSRPLRSVRQSRPPGASRAQCGGHISLSV